MTNRRPVRRLKSRERIPTNEHPNFRDHGKMVEGALLRIIGNLQKKHGQAWASEAGLRRLICEDTGHMPGVDTVRRALRRLYAQGIVEQFHLLPGGVRPDGGPCTYGTRCVWLPQCRHQRRALQARARRRPETMRVQRRAVADVKRLAAQLAAPRPTSTAAEREAFEVERRRQLAAARAFEDELRGRGGG